MKDVLIEKQVGDLVKYFSESEGLKRQAEGIIQIKKSKALRNLGIAVVLIVLGALGTVYGIVDVFGGKKLPRGVMFLIGGLCVLLGGVYMAFLSAGRAATASQVDFETDLETLCHTFYSNVFCSKTTDFKSKDDQIVDVCQFIPVPVLENYRKSGWDTFIGMPKPPSGGQPIACGRCRKKADHSETSYTPIPLATKYREEYKSQEPAETQNLIQNLFLKCQGCGSTLCYECVSYSIPKTGRFLCPVCGKATNGWTGLAGRWMNLRSCMVEQDVDFMLTSVEVDRSTRPDPRIVDVTIHLHGTPFGSLSLSNVALNIESNWFLATPEPLLADSRAIRERLALPQVPLDAGKLAFSVGIETSGNVFTALIESGTPVPCERREILSTAADNQTEIEVHVLHGSSLLASENMSLGEFKLMNLPKAPRGLPKIEVTFRVQQNSEFILIARDLERGKDVHVVRT